MKAILELGNQVVIEATEVEIFEQPIEGFGGQLKWEAVGYPKHGEYLLVLEDRRELRVDFHREGALRFSGEAKGDEPLNEDWLSFRLLAGPESKK
jgi:hypothetical protein